MTSFREYRDRLQRGDAPEVVEVTLPKEVRPFQGLRAGIVSRTVANSVDFAVMVVVVGALYLGYVAIVFLANPTGFVWPTLPWGVFLFVGFGWMVLYFAVLWAWTGRTYGNHLMGLRVVNFRGDRMRPFGALVRAGFCVGFPLGLFWVLISRENRSLQDVVVRTNVIYDWQVSVHQASEHALAAAGAPDLNPDGPVTDDERTA